MPTARLPISILLLSLACSWGCQQQRSVTGAVLEFCEAAQDRDFERLYCLSAGARVAEELGANEAERRLAFERWAEAELEAYLVGRDEGRVELNGHGIRLTRLFALGRGTFSSFGTSRSTGEGRREVETRLRFGYDRIDLSRFSPGTTLYLAAAPAGELEVVQVPAGYRELDLEVLDEVAVVWSLAYAAESELCPEGWTVAGATPLAGSEATRGLNWVF